MTFLVTDYVRNARVKKILRILNSSYLGGMRPKILDVGCGDMKITNTIRKAGYDIIGIDIHNEDTTWNVKPDLVMDATKMTFQDNSFDYVIAVEVLEHVKCLDEIKRVLKKDGILIATTPAEGSDWMRDILVKFRLLEAQDFHGKHDYYVDLKKIGMEVKEFQIMFLGASQFGVLINNGKNKASSSNSNV